MKQSEAARTHLLVLEGMIFPGAENAKMRERLASSDDEQRLKLMQAHHPNSADAEFRQWHACLKTAKIIEPLGG